MQRYKEVSSEESSAEEEEELGDIKPVTEHKPLRGARTPRNKVPAVIVQTLSQLLDSVMSIAESAAAARKRKSVVAVEIVGDESIGQILDHFSLHQAANSEASSPRPSAKKRSRSPSLESKIQDASGTQNVSSNENVLTSKRIRATDLRPLREKRLSLSPRLSPRRSRIPRTSAPPTREGSVEVPADEISRNGLASSQFENAKETVKVNLSFEIANEIKELRRGSLRRSRSVSQEAQPAHTATFPLEVKSAAVERLLGGETQTAVAQDLNINPSTLARWWAKRDVILEKVKSECSTQRVDEVKVTEEQQPQHENLEPANQADHAGDPDKNCNQVVLENVGIEHDESINKDKSETCQSTTYETSSSPQKLDTDPSECVKPQNERPDDPKDQIVVEKDLERSLALCNYLEIVPTSLPEIPSHSSTSGPPSPSLDPDLEVKVNNIYL